MTPLSDYRCKQCGKLLLKATLIDSELEVKCNRCRAINVFQGADSGPLICLKEDCAHRIPAVRRTETGRDPVAGSET